MADVVVLIPVLNRPERVQPLLESLYGSERDRKLNPLFLVSPGDVDEREAIRATDAEWLLMPEERQPGDYARKMNAGIRHSDEEFIFLGADDLCFCPGWADYAIDEYLGSRCRVVGTNDLGNSSTMRGHHSTHTLVERSYVELGTFDEPGVLLHDGYEHNFVDVEFIETAKLRGEYVHARASEVEHLHHFWHKGQDDETYRLGRDGYQRDSMLWHRRKALLAKTPHSGGAASVA